MGTTDTEVDAHQTVAQLIDFLQIPSQLSMIPVVNGQIVEMNYLLQEGDHFELIPPIEGGLRAIAFFLGAQDPTGVYP